MEALNFITTVPYSVLGYARPQNIGIVAFDVFFPKTYVDQAELEKHLKAPTGKFTIGLGQEKMAFCTDRIDSTAMALTTTKRLMDKTGVSPNEIGFLIVGTETPTDKSKSIKTSLMRLFGNNTDIEGKRSSVT